MTRVAEFRPLQASDSDEWHLRVDLAAAFRLAAHARLARGRGQPFQSLAVSPDGKKLPDEPALAAFLPHQGERPALLDAADRRPWSAPDAPDPTAWCIHGRMHAALPQARCMLHLHPALCDGARRPCRSGDQADRSEHGTVLTIGWPMTSAIGGMANNEAEGDRLARAARQPQHDDDGQSRRPGRRRDRSPKLSIDLYYLERACQTLVLAYSTGRPLNIMSDAVAEKTAQEWEEYAGQSLAHFEAMKEMLAEQDPGFAD